MMEITLKESSWESVINLGDGLEQCEVLFLTPNDSYPLPNQIDAVSLLADHFPALREKMDHLAQQYLNKFIVERDLTEADFVQAGPIADYYEPYALVVPKCLKDEPAYVSILCRAEFDTDMQMQFLACNGKIVGCGEGGTFVWGGDWNDFLATRKSDRAEFLTKMGFVLD